MIPAARIVSVASTFPSVARSGAPAEHATRACLLFRENGVLFSRERWESPTWNSAGGPGDGERLPSCGAGFRGDLVRLPAGSDVLLPRGILVRLPSSGAPTR